MLRKILNNKKYFFMYVFFAVFLIFLHSFIRTGTNDDACFAEILDNYKLTDYLTERYHDWTSRLPIDVAAVFLTRINPWVWKLLDTCILLLLVYECSVLFGKENNITTSGLFMLLILLLPSSMLNSAGWITTTLNYLWPVTIGMFALIPLHRWERKGSLTWWEFAFSFVAFLLGGFQEQMSAVLFTVYVLYAGYRIYHRKRIPLFWFLLFFLSCTLLLFILTCPGNARRSILETQRWFPEFADFSFSQKMLAGFLSTFSYYISCREFNTIFLLFTYVLFMAVFFLKKSVLHRVIALYPFLVTLLWGYGCRAIMQLNIATHVYWLGLVQNDRIPEQSIYNPWHVAIECVVFFTVLCAVLFCLFMVFGKTTDFCITFTILSAALCSRIILGFSPTVYISGSRTATAGYIGFIVLTFLCIQKSLSSVSIKKYGICFAPCYLLCLATTIMPSL